MISFVVPAHNEEVYLPRTLRAIHESAGVVGQPYEIVVVDDSSTDGTPEIARQNGARVVSVQHRQIAATRNSGARAAEGERIFFVDADTVINSKTVMAALNKMENGAVGGGAPVWIEKSEVVPMYIWPLALVTAIGSKLVGFSGGAFMFCTREAFKASGGFSEKMFWGEEGSFALALKREGRFAIVWPCVLTSGRRFRTTTGLQVLGTVLRTALSPRKMITQRESVKKLWYDSNRAKDDQMPNSLGAQVSNGIALAIILLLVTGPIWNFIPHYPLDTFLGKVRIIIVFFLCHAGLLFWPFAFVLTGNLLRQKRFTGMFQSVALIAFCVWQGWGSTLGVVWLWRTAYEAVKV